MMGVDPITLGIAALATAAIGTGYSAYASNEAAGAQRDAQDKARAQAEKQAKLQEEATNKANQKKPDINAILTAAQNASKAGGNSTMLTGPQGAAPTTLGSTNLLGS